MIKNTNFQEIISLPRSIYHKKIAQIEKRLYSDSCTFPALLDNTRLAGVSLYITDAVVTSFNMYNTDSLQWHQFMFAWSCDHASLWDLMLHVRGFR